MSRPIMLRKGSRVCLCVCVCRFEVGSALCACTGDGPWTATVLFVPAQTTGRKSVPGNSCFVHFLCSTFWLSALPVETMQVVFKVSKAKRN